MTRHIRIALATMVVLGLSGVVPGVHSASRDGAPTLARTVVLDGLEDPWDVAFTPDDALLVTEKCRGLSVRRPDGSLHYLFGHDGAAVAAPDFFCKGQSGAHGVVVDPAFAHNRIFYLFMPSTLSSPPANRVVRLVVDPDYTTVRARTDIVTDIPFKHAANAVGGAGAHSGGRAALRARWLPLHHYGRQSPADAAAGSDAPGGQSAAGGSRRPAGARQ